MPETAFLHMPGTAFPHMSETAFLQLETKQISAWFSSR
jgi:hypothetical protein